MGNICKRAKKINPLVIFDSLIEKQNKSLEFIRSEIQEKTDYLLEESKNITESIKTRRDNICKEFEKLQQNLQVSRDNFDEISNLLKTKQEEILSNLEVLNEEVIAE